MKLSPPPSGPALHFLLPGNVAPPGPPSSGVRQRALVADSTEQRPDACPCFTSVSFLLKPSHVYCQDGPHCSSVHCGWTRGSAACRLRVGGSSGVLGHMLQSGFQPARTCVAMGPLRQRSQRLGSVHRTSFYGRSCGQIAQDLLGALSTPRSRGSGPGARSCQAPLPPPASWWTCRPCQSPFLASHRTSLCRLGPGALTLHCTPLARCRRGEPVNGVLPHSPGTLQGLEELCPGILA